MKSVLFLSLLLFVKIGAAESQYKDISLEQDQIQLHLNLNQVKTSVSTEFVPVAQEMVKIEYQDWPNNNDVGKPMLPFQSFIFEGDISQIEITVEKGPSVALKGIPVPQAKYPCRCDKSNDEIKWVFDQKAYQQEEKFYQVEKIGDFRGKKLVRISVMPFQVEGQSTNVFPDLKLQFKGAKSLKYPLASKKLLIAGPSSFQDEMKTFIDWKIQHDGIETKFYAIDGHEQNPAQVKNFFKQVQAEWKYTHVIILGDETVVAMDTMKTSSSDVTPSDLPYFLWGGADDSVPDVLFGRLPAKTSSDLTGQTQKIIDYEKAVSGNRLIKKSLGIASDEGSSPSDVEYMESMLNPLASIGWSSTKVFQADRNHQNSDIAKAFNNGLGWVNYIGHGSGYSWISVRDREFESKQISEIKYQQGQATPVIVDVACQNGRLSGDGRLGETFLKSKDQNNNPIGAVAFYGGTVDISWHPPAVMAVGINQIYQKLNQQDLGTLLFEGQLHLIKNWRNLSEAVENWRWYTLSGDPTLSLSSH